MKQYKLKLQILFILTLLTSLAFAQNGEGTKISPCEEELSPQPADGFANLFEWIRNSNSWNSDQSAARGTVFVRFSVDTVGTISNIKVAKGLTEDTDNEALRIIESMPIWLPNQNQENRLKCFMVLPIHFQGLKPTSN